MNNLTDASSCYLGPDISPEQFVAEHLFIFVIEGEMEGFDGQQYLRLEAGSAVLVRKNRLVHYRKHRQPGRYEKMAVRFDEALLRRFLERHPKPLATGAATDTFVHLQSTDRLAAFVQSLRPYYLGGGQLDPAFAEVKREELLLLLLQQQPELAAILFDFRRPGRLDLESFMATHYKFNVSLERFAFLTGRSLSAFKRDFKAIFNSSPAAWLVRRRLEEAHFLLTHQATTASDIYLELGFEDLSHFSFAFKKQFGYSPRQLQASNTQAAD